MKLPILAALTTVFTLSACSNTPTACEDVTLASEQIQACQILQRQITSAKNKPLMRTELERRYQQDCIDIRYYRDDHQNAICGNKKQLKTIKEAVLEEQKQ